MTQLQAAPAGTAATGLEEKVRDRVESLSYLPTTVAVAMKFVELGKDPDAEPSDYARVISSDSSLSSKLLSLANSSWFGVRNKVTKPQTAVNLLGLGTVRTLAISYCLTGLHNDLRLTPEESRMFWSASLCKAAAARQYALLFDKKLAEEAFTAALFQDFAMPIMFAVARDALLPLLRDVQLNAEQRLQTERELFHLDHTEMGRVVAQKLELPDLFVDAVAFHHNRNNLTEMIARTPLAEAIFAAGLFPHTLDAWNHDDAQVLQQFVAEKLGPQGIEPARFLEAVQQEFNQIYRYFEQGDAPQAKLPELLEQATREAADHTTRLVGTVHEMLQEAANTGKSVHQILKNHSDLAEAVHRDTLTGALNREGFNARAGELISKAARYGTGLAVIYLDIDRFKALNDTQGHAAGDAALRKVVATIQNSVRQNDIVARLGGDEFVILLCDCSEAGASAVVERILARVAGEPVVEGPPEAPVTLSAGFLWVSAKQTLYPLETLVATADRLMYEAKRAGGNRMCKGSAQAIEPAAQA